MLAHALSKMLDRLTPGSAALPPLWSEQRGAGRVGVKESRLRDCVGDARQEADAVGLQGLFGILKSLVGRM